MPCDVRWNSVTDCLKSYLENWAVLMKVCDRHKEDISSSVIDKVCSMELKYSAETYLKCLRPISMNLDRLQSNKCTISESVEIWLDVLSEAEKNERGAVVAVVKERMEKAIDSQHYLANIIDPRYLG